MTEAVNKIMELVAEFQIQAYAIITLSCIAIGYGLIRSSETAEKTKKRIPAVIAGWVIICGCITIGAKYGNSLKF